VLPQLTPDLLQLVNDVIVLADDSPVGNNYGHQHGASHAALGPAPGAVPSAPVVPGPGAILAQSPSAVPIPGQFPGQAIGPAGATTGTTAVPAATGATATNSGPKKHYQSGGSVPQRV